MNESGEMAAWLVQPVERRRVLLRALGLVGAAAALRACKHTGGPVIEGGEGGDDRGVGTSSGTGSGSGGGTNGGM